MEPGEKLENEAEFMAYYLLAHPTTHTDIPFLERAISQDVFLSPEVQFAITLRELLQRTQAVQVLPVHLRSEGGYRSMERFFRLLLNDPRATALVAMVCEMQFARVRSDGLRTMDRAYRHPFPANELAEWMSLDSAEQALAWADLCDLKFTGKSGADGMVNFGEREGGKTLFRQPDDASLRRLDRQSKHLIGDKLEQTNRVGMLMGDRSGSRPLSTMGFKPSLPRPAVAKPKLPLDTRQIAQANERPTISTSFGGSIVPGTPGKQLAPASFGTAGMQPVKPLAAQEPAKEASALAPTPLPALTAKAPQFSFGQAAQQLARPASPPAAVPSRSTTLPPSTVPPARPIVPPLLPSPGQQVPADPKTLAGMAPSTKPLPSLDVPSMPPTRIVPERLQSAVNLSPRKLKMAADVAAAILVETLVEESVRIATRALAESALVRDQLVHATLTAVLYDKLLSMISRDVAKDSLAELKRTQRLQRWAFYRWRLFCGRNATARTQKKAKEESLASRRTSFLSAVRDLTLAGDHSSPVLRLQQVRTSFPRALEARYSDNDMDESETGSQNDVVEAGRLAREIYDVLVKSARGEIDMFCKVVVSTPSLVAPRTSSEWNLVRWLRAGFGFDPEDSDAGQQIDALDQEVFVEPLLDVAFRADAGATTLHLLVQRIDIPEPWQDLESPRPEEGFLTGPSGALFILAPFESGSTHL